MNERYIRQFLFKKLKESGQEQLLRSRIAIVGMGALGCVSANETVRAGVGFVRLIDDDRVDLSNLHRQILYSEDDALHAVPKVHAAAEVLRTANSEIEIQPVFEKLTADNSNELLGEVDLIIDATDNMSTRFLINEYCVEHRIPWVYGGAVDSEGMPANFLPGGPCLSCMLGTTHPSDSDAPPRIASTVGVLNMLTGVVASVQTVEAVKILTGSPDVRKDMLFFDIWENEFERLPLEKNPECPICARHEYHFLKGK